MKKIVLVLCGFIFNSQTLLAKEIGTVLISRGQAEIIHNSKGQKIKIGSRISEGDQIETQANAYLKVVMNDRNVLVLAEKTKLTITEYKTTKDNKQVLMALEKGSARHSLEQKYSQKNEKYEVRTATTVAGVRGTDFLTEFETVTGDTVLCALTGKVSFDLLNDGAPALAPVLVEAGHFVRLKKGEVILKVIQTNAVWLEKALKRLSLE